jgi:hypothetical protein
MLLYIPDGANVQPGKVDGLEDVQLHHQLQHVGLLVPDPIERPANSIGIHITYSKKIGIILLNGIPHHKKTKIFLST